MTCFTIYDQGRSYLSLRLNPEVIESSRDLQSIINEVKKEMEQIDSSVLFEYSFMDEEFESTFRSEQRMGRVLTCSRSWP